MTNLMNYDKVYNILSTKINEKVKGYTRLKKLLSKLKNDCESFEYKIHKQNSKRSDIAMDIMEKFYY